jgi:hypothetical protein
VEKLHHPGYSNSTSLARGQIASLNVAWHYNWEAYCNLTTPPFTPMVKKAQRLLEENAIGKIMNQLPQTQAKHLLGFNEPDYATQANHQPLAEGLHDQGQEQGPARGLHDDALLRVAERGRLPGQGQKAA